jgi:hypothetical protein
VHAVGDIADRYLCLRPVRKETLKNASTYRAVQTADAVNPPTPAGREIRHIEGFTFIVGYGASQREEPSKIDAEALVRVSLEVLADQARREAIEAGFHRGVGGKNIPGSRDCQLLTAA